MVEQAPGTPRTVARAGRPGLDGRAVVLGCVAAYFVVVAAFRSVWRIDLWPWLGVPPGPSLFFDARNIAAAVDCSRLGYDPLADNPCDPWQRTMFYPRVWLVLRWTGLDQAHTLLFGALVVALYLLLLVALLPRLSVREGLVVAAAACSPAVMFAVERANMDLVIFSGLAAAALLWRRGSSVAQYAAVAVVLLMAVAKLYPALALLAFLPAARRRVAAAAVAALAVFVGYAVLTRADVATISAAATQGQYDSYGARILLGRLYHGVVGNQWAGSRTVAQGLVLLATVLVAIMLWFVLRRRWSGLVRRQPMPDTAELLAFRMGALVYVGTFVAGNSFDYRLVCLLLVLPGLLRWPAGDGGSARPTLPRVTLGVVVLMLWIGALSEQLRLWDELVSWALAVLLVVLLARSVPPAATAWRPGGPRPGRARDPGPDIDQKGNPVGSVLPSLAEASAGGGWHRHRGGARRPRGGRS
jgi:hypothetical protein